MRPRSPLYVITAISNPVRYKSRYRLYQDFAKRVADQGATLITVEVAFGDREHSVTQRDDPRHVQLRTWDEIWIKENALNVGVEYLSQLDPDWQYVAWVDADVTFARPDWAAETVEQMQHYMVVQMFSKAHDLGPNEEIFDTYNGFVWSYRNRLLDGPIGTCPSKYMTGWHPGYGWAWRREAVDAVRWLDVAILGSGDQHMARALIGRGRDSINPGMHPNYLAAVDRFQELAERHIRRDVGYVEGSVLHHWHGRKRSRGYLDRWKILRDLRYDPHRDIKRDAQGLYQLVDHGDVRSIELRDQIRGYFRSRNEDSIDVA
ncbi:MAG TPA: hypothetical protein VK324_06680 [Tepidisphaeraceae bacterium]|nr:hypothetical protein [Tepidisphaeraceae bacterium]